MQKAQLWLPEIHVKYNGTTYWSLYILQSMIVYFFDIMLILQYTNFDGDIPIYLNSLLILIFLLSFQTISASKATFKLKNSNI